MAITTRLLRTSRPLGLSFLSSSASSSSSVRCLGLNKEKSSGEKRLHGNGDKMSKNSVVKAVSVASETLISTQSPTKAAAVYLSSVVADVTNIALRVWKPLVKRRSWKRQAEMLIEKGVLDCRFFTLLAVAGTLLGSVLCFIEGAFLILHSYFEYFQTISNHSLDKGHHVVQLLIEAIDMFLVGSAMFIFGTGLYVLFMGSRSLKSDNGGLYGSNFFGHFYLKMFPGWLEMQCISQAKSKIGHAILMILQVGVVEKFKNVPLVTGIDLACFAGAILVSSACIFLLSKLSLVTIEGGR